jgi:hypothetical protein
MHTAVGPERRGRRFEDKSIAGSGEAVLTKESRLMERLMRSRRRRELMRSRLRLRRTEVAKNRGDAC